MLEVWCRIVYGIYALAALITSQIAVGDLTKLDINGDVSYHILSWVSGNSPAVGWGLQTFCNVTINMDPNADCMNLHRGDIPSWFYASRVMYIMGIVGTYLSVFGGCIIFFSGLTGVPSIKWNVCQVIFIGITCLFLLLPVILMGAKRYDHPFTSYSGDLHLGAGYALAVTSVTCMLICLLMQLFWLHQMIKELSMRTDYEPLPPLPNFSTNAISTNIA